jgi:PAS domain S-box-containing protein
MIRRIGDGDIRMAWRSPRNGATYRLPRALLLCVGAAGAILCVILVIGGMLWDARRIAAEHIAQSSENLAAAIAHDIERSIEVYDLSLQAVIEGLRLPGIDALSPEMRSSVLFDRAASARHFGSMMVLDATGRVAIDSQPPAAPRDADFADSEFFRIHRDHPEVGLLVSAPVRDPQTGSWGIPVSRRLAQPDGSFAGVVFGTLRLAFFSQLFAPIDTGPDGSIALFSTEGILIYRYPVDAQSIGEAVLFPHDRRSRADTFEAVSPVDGINRLYAFRQIGELPLLLTVGAAQHSVLAEWSRKAVIVAVVMLGLALVVCLMGSALVAELRRRGRAERAAVESGQRYRQLAESSFDMIVRFNPRTQRRTYVSPACRRLYDYEPEEAMRMSAEEIIHPDDLPKVQEALRGIEAGGHEPITYRGRRKDGTYIWVEASLMHSTDPETGAAEVVSVVREISERVRYEAALREAKDQADAANRAKSQFLGTMSHELRTPLNAIIGFAEIMREEVLGPVGNAHYRSYVADIHFSGMHLLNLINEILDLTKAEAGKLQLHEEIFDLREVILSVVRISGPPIDKAGLTVTIDLPPSLPLLRADERKTRQVFFNLIGNAIKFTPAGGRIDISGRFDSHSGFIVTVADTGIGIAPENLDRVLEPFVQVDSTLSRRHAGTGLGLPAARAIMELHRGKLELVSTVDAGTAVTITFPPEAAITEHNRDVARSAA